MSDESKYYTPEIEEFHVGFEYEFSVEDGGWMDAVIQEGTQIDDIHVIFMDIPAYKLKVKHLDHDDLESLGFIEGHGYWWDHPDGYELALSPDAVFITKGYADPKTLNYCFKGIIKNKSELKRILKQIGV